ncbi:MAG: hypothetical protein ABL901_15550 [Hyphomicrobiaceae bacterium]
MGAEELKKRRKTHEKFVDRKRVELATPDFFTHAPVNEPRTAIASLEIGVEVHEGECLLVEARDGRLAAHRGNIVVATFKKPPADIISAISQGAGAAQGIVKRVYTLSRTAEVLFA